jgi:predicted Zn-dependent protease
MPKSEVPQLALGALEFSQGRHDKALQAYRAAQRLAPNASLPRAHAGEALLFMGKVPEATKELKAALDLEPESDGARLAQALIQAKDAGALPPPKK